MLLFSGVLASKTQLMLGLKVMHNGTKLTSSTFSINSLRIIRALKLLKQPQRASELAEGLDLYRTVVNQELDQLAAAGIITVTAGKSCLNPDAGFIFHQLAGQVPIGERVENVQAS